MTELLDQALEAIERDPRSTPKPVAEIERLVRRRQNRRRATVGTLAAGLVIAVALGASARHDGRTASPADDRLKGILLNAHVLVPTAVPQGLRFDGLTAQGGAFQTTDPVMRQIALADVSDPNRFLRVEATPGGGIAMDWDALTRQMLPTTIRGAQSAAYGMVDSGVVGMQWIKNGDWYNATGYGVSLDDIRTWASTLTIGADRALTNAASIAGLQLVREGPMMTEGARIDQAWRTKRTDGPWLDVRVLGNAPWSGPSLRLGKGEPITVASAQALYYEAPAQRTVAWLDADGVQHEIASNGLTREELLAVVASLVPLDADRWHRLRSTVASDRISDLTAPLPGQPGAQTAGPTTAAPSPRPDSGFSDTGVRASELQVGHSIVKNAVAIVHTTDDRWVGISTYVEPGGGNDGCQVVPEQGADGRLIAWNAPCTGGRYASDGTCINDRCVVGLVTYETRVVDDRIEMDPDRFHVGIPRDQPAS